MTIVIKLNSEARSGDDRDTKAERNRLTSGMAPPVSRIVPVDELRLRPANSNDRARAGMLHAFKDVPRCAFATDDGISSYIGAATGIDAHPDSPAAHEPIHDDVPEIAQDGAPPAPSPGHRLLRTGLGLSVLLHGLIATAIGYATIRAPSDDALLEGEAVLAVEFFSETDSEVTTRVRQQARDRKEEADATALEQAKRDVARPVSERVERARLPGTVEEPLTAPEKMEHSIVTDRPNVLSTTEPSDFEIEAAARQIIGETEIGPLPDSPPPILTAPVEEKEVEAEAKLAEMPPVDKPVARDEEPKPVEKKPAPRKRPPRKIERAKPDGRTKPEKKKVLARDGNAESDANKGSSRAAKKDGNSQDASQGNSKKKAKGNASTSNYKGLVQRKLERAKKRVRVAAKGTVVVSFTISTNGSVVNLRVRKSSGKPAIDKGALDIVRLASPFPAIPAEAGLKSYPVSVPMTFKGNLGSARP